MPLRTFRTSPIVQTLDHQQFNSIYIINHNTNHFNCTAHFPIDSFSYYSTKGGNNNLPRESYLSIYHYIMTHCILLHIISFFVIIEKKKKKRRHTKSLTDQMAIRRKIEWEKCVFHLIYSWCNWNGWELPAFLSYGAKCFCGTDVPGTWGNRGEPHFRRHRDQQILFRRSEKNRVYYCRIHGQWADWLAGWLAAIFLSFGRTVEFEERLTFRIMIWSLLC